MDAKTNGATPATPVECQWRRDGSVAHGIQTGSTTGFATGLTKREAFAMHLMAAYRANDSETTADVLASWARHDADALLAALSQEPQ